MLTFERFSDKLPEDRQRIVIIAGAVLMQTGTFRIEEDEGKTFNSIDFVPLSEYAMGHWFWKDYEDFWHKMKGDTYV